MGSTIITWIIIGFVFLGLTMLAFVDVARKDFGSTGKKALWAVVALVPFVGWLLYFALGMRKGKILHDHNTES
ncbi:MAG: PLDc N-terminal domain-containing protein [Desulfobacterales bacterium]|nr:PLDc N-terminal domain-containing protein [Desulfobacterales bacterium]